VNPNQPPPPPVHPDEGAFQSAPIEERDVGAHLPPTPIPADLYRLFIAAGHELHWQETTAATMPSPNDAASLQIPDGLPLLIHLRVTLNADGVPLALEKPACPPTGPPSALPVLR